MDDGSVAEQSNEYHDPLESVHYQPSAHLNALFPSVESLTILPRIDSKLYRYEIELQRSIKELRATAQASKHDSEVRTKKVEVELKDLFQAVESIQERARTVEQGVSDMTRDIKKLDVTKKNLTATMTIIKRLQMLMTAFDQLQKLASGKKYAETASLLSAVIQLMTHFRAYRSIPQIALLSQNIADLQRSLLEKVSADFELYFSSGLSSQSKATLNQACELVDVLGEGARDRIIMWYTNSQLREYRNIFRSNEEAASLDNISRRYAWLKRIYKTYDEDHSAIFPESWRVLEHLVKSSCDTTREDLNTVLQKSTPDIKILLQALQESLDFEKYLTERATDGLRTPRASVDSVRSAHSEGSTTEKRIYGIRLSEVFEPYLGQFVEVQDKTLSSMLAGYRSAPWPDLDEQVLPSSADLFYFYLTTLTQCAELSNGEPLWQFARVMAKYLNEYAEKILNSKYQLGVVTVEEIIMVLKTSDYCGATTQQLEERMKASIAPQYVERVTYEHQNQTFLSLTNRSLTLLVSHLEKVIDNALKEMSKIPWSEVSEVGDQSQYVSLLIAGLLREGKRVLQNLGKEKFVRTFCDRVVEGFVNAYVASIGRCRPVSEIGAEQMLLDIHAIKVALLNLPGSETTASYTKLVNKQMLHLETLLKVLLSSATPPDGLIQNYLYLIQDKNTVNFIKVLDIKGVPKYQQQPILNKFITTLQSYESDLADRNPVLGNLSMVDARVSEDRKLDPSSFFRDQLGIGASQPVSRANTPAPERFGSQIGRIFSKRTVSGMNLSSNIGQ
ncbi:putative GARP complex subunit Vps53 [Taphrina deformans PYCC 5710]|uniref:GARP complex subunit Vps53 n=1 Tax=Taphrina deformans (strain PYCC 5710 / ATCC 11124 / CBS 356.35 / IMI 108563 / JCM 9778 / NBRC 8474) TaxID=1097556 RepID=R4XIV3_TAPDE|nr:putative GARP complex subunit Vps53 [Taphrina deformans PYCC 5710]|eukprot:CCG83298.1 putative GARP complex subunit Vps53 [Taphrina deformans PYCC 5710]